MPRWGEIFGGALQGAGGLMSDLALRRMQDDQQRQMQEDRQQEARTVAETLAAAGFAEEELRGKGLAARAGAERREGILKPFYEGTVPFNVVNQQLLAQGLDPVTTSGKAADARVAESIRRADTLATLPTEGAAVRRAQDERALWPVPFGQPLKSFSPTYDQSVDPVTGRLSLEAAGPSRMDPEGPLVQNIRDLVGEQRANIEKSVALQYGKFIAGEDDSRVDIGGDPLIAGVEYEQGRNFAGDRQGPITRTGLTLDEETALAEAKSVTGDDPTASELANAAAFKQLLENHNAAIELEAGDHVLPHLTAGAILSNPSGLISQILQSWTLSPEQQEYLNHSQSFATVIVQRLSGVQFRENEYGRYLMTLFATTGNSASAIAAKQQQRQSFLNSIILTAGQAADVAGESLGRKMISGELSIDMLQWMDTSPEFEKGLERAGLVILDAR